MTEPTLTRYDGLALENHEQLCNGRESGLTSNCRLEDISPLHSRQSSGTAGPHDDTSAHECHNLVRRRADGKHGGGAKQARGRGKPHRRTSCYRRMYTWPYIASIQLHPVIQDCASLHLHSRFHHLGQPVSCRPLEIAHVIRAYPAPNTPPVPFVSASGPTTIHSGTGTPVRRGNKRMIRSRPPGDVADMNITKEVADVGCSCKKARPARFHLNETIGRTGLGEPT